MANSDVGELEFVVAKRTFTLRYSMNSVSEIENKLDRGINEITEMLRTPSDFRVSVWRAVLWGGLRDRHPNITLEQAGEMMDRAGLPAVIDAVTRAMAISTPERADENPRSASE